MQPAWKICTNRSLEKEANTLLTMEQKQLGAYYVSNVFYSDMFCINFNWCLLHLSLEVIRISSIVPYAVAVKYSKYRTVYVGFSCSCCLCVFLRSEWLWHRCSVSWMNFLFDLLSSIELKQFALKRSTGGMTENNRKKSGEKEWL